MGRYRKLPVEVEAFQWTGGPDQTDDPEWIIEAMVENKAWVARPGQDDCHLMLVTLEGTMRANPGDFIVRGVEGEIYPVKPDIFAKTYELVEVERWQYNRQPRDEWPEWLQRSRVGEFRFLGQEQPHHIAIHVEGGAVLAEAGDWVELHPDGIKVMAG
jgi:hypothetical protein